MNYFQDKVKGCRHCSSDVILAKYLTFEKLPPFGFNNRKVLIIGHSPTVRSNSKITITLDLNRKSNIYNYINTEVLIPLGIKIEDCYATNLVKCLTSEMPEDIVLNDKTAFMDTAFTYCKTHLIEEIKQMNPSLIISLSERVSNLLQSEFLKTKKSMKEIYGTLQKLEIENRVFNWIPVVHLPNAKVRSFYFPEQTKRLVNLSNRI